MYDYNMLDYNMMCYIYSYIVFVLNAILCMCDTMFLSTVLYLTKAYMYVQCDIHIPLLHIYTPLDFSLISPSVYPLIFPLISPYPIPQDTPWTLLTMSKIGRQARFFETSLHALNRLRTSTTMDITSAYTKLREQILYCYTILSYYDYINGINIINSTNLEYFNIQQKAELFRLVLV